MKDVREHTDIPIFITYALNAKGGDIFHNFFAVLPSWKTDIYSYIIAFAFDIQIP
jgi:hypothetical protein